MNPITALMQAILRTRSTNWFVLLALVASLLAFGGRSTASAAETVTEKVSAVTTDAEKKLQAVQETAKGHWEDLWRRVDEQRLKNRTPDQLVAWVIMGLLVGGMIHQFSKLKQITTVLLGLAGAFVGGIVANIAGFDLKLGPVLIRYEDLIASLVGGVVIVLIARWFASRRTEKK